MAALQWALRAREPEIFNSDQGSQFTSEVFTGLLLAHNVQIRMDGRGRAMDNIFVELLWRTVKYEEVYLKDYEDVPDAIEGLRHDFLFYNQERMPPSLDHRTPEQVHYQERLPATRAGKQLMVMIGSP